MKKICLVTAAFLAVGTAQAQNTNAPFYTEVGYVNLKLYGVTVGAVRGIAGWNAHPYLAVEMMLAQGVSKGKLEGNDTSYELSTSTGLFLKPKFAVTSSFEVFGRVGIAKPKAKTDERGWRQRFDDTDLAWGAGAAYRFGPHWTASIDYMTYYDKKPFKIDGTAVNVGYQF